MKKKQLALEKEFNQAMDYAKVNKRAILGAQDQQLKRNLGVINCFLDKNYDYVFVPYRKDLHPDHKCIFKHVNRYLKRKLKKTVIVEYEVWTPIKSPNFFWDISNVYEKKGRLIQCYRCQLVHVQYDWGALGLNRFRGMLNGTTYAEAYYVNYSIVERIKAWMRRKNGRNESIK